MWEIGRLKDSGVSTKIERTLLSEGIEGKVVFVAETNEYVVVVNDEKYIQPALDIYRVHLGIAKPVEMPEEWFKIRAVKNTKISLSLIIISVAIYIFKMMYGDSLLSYLLLSNQHGSLFLEISNGQIWRVWTPMFLHFNFFHILFNSMWIKDLGKLCENQMNAKGFVLFLLVAGMVSNIAQYLITGPLFGGLSGVVYGLLGYLWVYRVTHPDIDSFSLPKRDIYMMIGWFFLCMTGVFGAIANTAHGVGLSIGMIWGVFPIKKSKANLMVSFKYIILAIVFSSIAMVIDVVLRKGMAYFMIHNLLGQR
ncbi:MAG: rhomboid family intramembrane serine protease [Bacteriovoracaceae bacterium]|nr:rhomboid family intramembrane serine protease [Bacteriovoracaceae bacterium]